MESRKTKDFTIGLTTIFGSILTQAPAQFRTAVIQKENLWARKFVSFSLILWSAWYGLLIFLSDLQKADPRYYIAVRVSVIVASLLMIISIQKLKIKRNTLSIISILAGSMFMMSYVSFSYTELQVRTSWVTVLPAAFAIVTSWRGSRVVAGYLMQILLGLYFFNQTINPIYIVSDLLFGGLILVGGLLIKAMWLQSVVLQLEKDEADRRSIDREQKIYQAIETFVPKILRKKIKNHVDTAGNALEMLQNISAPQMQHVSIMYSDFRNYSAQSSNIDFIRNELMDSSSTLIEFSENYDGIVQNRGDSIIAAFLESDESINACRAAVVAARSSNSEFARVRRLGKTTPDRYMIVTSGDGVFCNLAGGSRNEVTIAGKPANLAARIDELTKNLEISKFLQNEPVFIIDSQTKASLGELGAKLNLSEINLDLLGVSIRTYTDEHRIYVVSASLECIESLDRALGYEHIESRRVA